MAQSGAIDINVTLSAWAEIVIDKWHASIQSMDVIDTAELSNSLMHQLMIGAGENIDKIEFSFKLYGIFVDMGVGKEIKKGNSGDLGFTPKRQPKEWYSKRFYAQIMRLKQILMEKYSQSIAWNVMNVLNESLDQRYTSALESHSVVNLRSVRYRGTTNARNMRNYQRRRALQGEWTNDHKTWKPNG